MVILHVTTLAILSAPCWLLLAQAELEPTSLWPLWPRSFGMPITSTYEFADGATTVTLTVPLKSPSYDVERACLLALAGHPADCTPPGRTSSHLPATFPLLLPPRQCATCT